MEPQLDGDIAALKREDARRRKYVEQHGGLIGGICFDCLAPKLVGDRHTCREDRRGSLARVRRELATWVKAHR